MLLLWTACNLLVWHYCSAQHCNFCLTATQQWRNLSEECTSVQCNFSTGTYGNVYGSLSQVERQATAHLTTSRCLLGAIPQQHSWVDSAEHRCRSQYTPLGPCTSDSGQTGSSSMLASRPSTGWRVGTYLVCSFWYVFTFKRWSTPENICTQTQLSCCWLVTLRKLWSGLWPSFALLPLWMYPGPVLSCCWLANVGWKSHKEAMILHCCSTPVNVPRPYTQLLLAGWYRMEKPQRGNDPTLVFYPCGCTQALYSAVAGWLM